MKRIEILLLVFLLTFPFAKSLATEQRPDKLIYKGDTISISTYPLNQFYYNDTLRPKFFDNDEDCMSSACWRGYKAEWIISNDQLYLTGIFSCCFNKDSIKADLKELFGNKVMDGKVKADWFSGIIRVNLGKPLLRMQISNTALYEKEIEFEFRIGQLISAKTFKNRKYFNKIRRKSIDGKPSK